MCLGESARSSRTGGNISVSGAAVFSLCPDDVEPAIEREKDSKKIVLELLENVVIELVWMDSWKGLNVSAFVDEEINSKVPWDIGGVCGALQVPKNGMSVRPVHVDFFEHVEFSAVGFFGKFSDF